MKNDVILVLVVITALSFDFTNGFHDTGNAMATSIATGALSPRVAVALSGLLNLVGAFLSLAVAVVLLTALIPDGKRQRPARQCRMAAIDTPADPSVLFI